MTTNQGYKDVEDKLNDLTPWLEKLLQTLAKANPNNDPEETERRSLLARFALHVAYAPLQRLTLRRSLEYVGKRSLAILDKGRVARVLDKSQDSQELIGLLERLRQAAIIYQMGQGDAVVLLATGSDHGIAPSAPISAPLTPHNQEPNGIRTTLSRVNRLTFFHTQTIVWFPIQLDPSSEDATNTRIPQITPLIQLHRTVRESRVGRTPFFPFSSLLRSLSLRFCTIVMYYLYYTTPSVMLTFVSSERWCTTKR